MFSPSSAGQFFQILQDHQKHQKDPEKKSRNCPKCFSLYLTVSHCFQFDFATTSGGTSLMNFPKGCVSRFHRVCRGPCRILTTECFSHRMPRTNVWKGRTWFCWRLFHLVSTPISIALSPKLACLRDVRHVELYLMLLYKLKRRGPRVLACFAEIAEKWFL